MIKFILLGFLNYQQMTGYELKQFMDESIAHFWHAYHSQIYTSLRQMEKEGLVTSEFVQGESQPDRRIYTITEGGKQELKDWLAQTLTERSPIKEELLVRLFFSAQRDPQHVLTELRLQHELHSEKLAAYHVTLEHNQNIREQMDPCLERDQKFWMLTLDLGIHYEEVYIAWLENAIKTIEAL
jgi:PadR family transcriptional regulator, regulatory protein AphA